MTQVGGRWTPEATTRRLNSRVSVFVFEFKTWIWKGVEGVKEGVVQRQGHARGDHATPHSPYPSPTPAGGPKVRDQAPFDARISHPLPAPQHTRLSSTHPSSPPPHSPYHSPTPARGPEVRDQAPYNELIAYPHPLGPARPCHHTMPQIFRYSPTPTQGGRGKGPGEIYASLNDPPQLLTQPHSHPAPHSP